MVAAWPLDALVAAGFSLDPRHLCGLWWQHVTETSTQTLVVVGPGTDMGPWAQMSPWSQEAVQATWTDMAPQQHGRHTPTWPQVSAHTPNINKVLESLRNHRYQHRHWLWFDHRPRHGPHLQSWSGQYHGPSSQYRPDPSVPSWGIALRHQQSNRLQQRS